MTDALNILSTGSLENNLYMFDDNRREGSYGQGSSELVTVLDFQKRKPEEYEIIWLIENMRPDVAVAIEDMQVGEDAVQIEQETYEDTDISYWRLRVLHAFEMLEGELVLRIAGSRQRFTHKFTIRRKEVVS